MNRSHRLACGVLLCVLMGTAPAQDGSEAQEDTTSESPSNESSPEPGADTLLRIPVYIKNASSFKKTLSVYDENCRRYAIFSKRFKGWQKERIEVCADAEGHADLTVQRAFGARRKHFRDTAVNAVVKFR